MYKGFFLGLKSRMLLCRKPTLDNVGLILWFYCECNTRCIPLPHSPSPWGSLVCPGSLCWGWRDMLYLLQQSYPHGPVGGGEHLHDDWNDLLLVLLRWEELSHLAEDETETHRGSQGKDIHPFFGFLNLGILGHYGTFTSDRIWPCTASYCLRISLHQLLQKGLWWTLYLKIDVFLLHGTKNCRQNESVPLFPTEGLCRRCADRPITIAPCSVLVCAVLFSVVEMKRALAVRGVR